MDYGVNDDYLDEDDDGIMYSTKNYCSDSDEENFSAFCVKKSKRKSAKDCSSDEEDDFEKEMNAELNATMKQLTAPTVSLNCEDKTEAENSHYDKIYFDSDEEDDSPMSNGRKDKHKVLTDDELFYDPLMDDADQAWVDNNRRSYQLRSKRLKTKTGGNKLEPLPHSDAVLNCPACFTTLCLDCQRHEIYKNQYRAMFVFNCVVDKTERLHFGLKEDKKKNLKKNKKRKAKVEEISNEESASMEATSEASASTTEPNADNAINGMDDVFNPVKCALCNTKVAVQDQSEIYHFFNVLTSY